MIDRYPDIDNQLRVRGLLALATEKVLGAPVLSASDEVRKVCDWPEVPTELRVFKRQVRHGENSVEIDYGAKEAGRAIVDLLSVQESVPGLTVVRGSETSVEQGQEVYASLLQDIENDKNGYGIEKISAITQMNIGNQAARIHVSIEQFPVEHPTVGRRFVTAQARFDVARPLPDGSEFLQILTVPHSDFRHPDLSSIDFLRRGIAPEALGGLTTREYAAQHVEHDSRFPALEPLGLAACAHILR